MFVFFDFIFSYNSPWFEKYRDCFVFHQRLLLLTLFEVLQVVLFLKY